ncbi:MAG: hypothetical protein ABIN37_17615 [Burkholderiaceae bacterium]
MRLLLLILMMALLPLRGLAGDVMAIRTATHLPSNTAVVATAIPVAAVAVAAASHADCMGRADATPEQGPFQGTGSSGHCTTCPSCQVCFSAALPVLPAIWSTASLPNTVPRIGASVFFSAVSAPGLKPPIS